MVGQSNRLKVTVTRRVKNAFGGLFGLNTTTISRSSTAAFSGPLPLGSPCNEFGNDPTPGTAKAANCSAVGQFWANVGSVAADKKSGDAYANGYCSANAPTFDGCASNKNTEYENDGYFYTLTVKQDLPSLTVEAFDPGFVSVGDACDTNFGSGAALAANAKNDYVYDVGAGAYLAGESADTTTGRYAKGGNGAYCTGDKLFGAASTSPDTTFTVRKPVAATSPWDPQSYTPVSGCTATYPGYSGDLYTKLNQWNQVKPGSTYVVDTSSGAPVANPSYDPALASTFRRWTPVCTMTNVTKGTYMIQVQTNGPADRTGANGHNRYSLRAFGASASQNNDIAVAGFTKMAIYANLPGAVTQFFLAQVPPTAKGQTLAVRLYDIGDSTNTGTISILPPPDSSVSAFDGCIGNGPRTGALSNCSITANATDFQGRWQVISIPIPTTYTCDSSAATGCWVRLQFSYGAGNTPSDTTSWQASVAGDPVRLVR